MPLPAPLPLWAKAALYLAPFAYSAGQSVFDAITQEDDEDALAWLHVVYHATRTTPTGTSEDRAQISFDVCKLTAGGNDGTWDTAQATAVVGHLNNLIYQIVPYQDNNILWNEVRAYVKRFKEAGSGFADSGDPVYQGALAIAGAANEGVALPYQVSLSVTEKTALRKHWGRFYIPNPRGGLLDSYARWTGASMDTLVAAIGGIYEALAEDNFVVVVPSAGSRTLFTVTELQIDDVPDVIRRRRPRTTLHRSHHPALP